MKKRTAFIGAILSLIPLGQPLLIKTGVVLSSSVVMLSLPEKVNARNYVMKLSCDVKTHASNWGEVWSDMSNRNWNLEIDYKNNLLVRRQNILYKGKNYPLTFKYSIVTNNQNKIVAFEDDLTTEQGGIAAGSITLDLISKQVTSSNHMNDERGYAFTLHYGKCF